MREAPRRRPSPAMVVAMLALVVAIVGTAVAGPLATKSVLNKKEKRQTKSIATNIVNSLASGLSVAGAQTATNATNANNADNADKVDGQDASAFVPSGQYQNLGRRVVNDTTPGDAAGSNFNFISGSDLTVSMTCWQDEFGGTNEHARWNIFSPGGDSISVSVERSTGTWDNSVIAGGGVLAVELVSSANALQSAHFIAVTPGGRTVSGFLSAEVNDTAPGGSDCTFGGTALG